MTIPLCKERTWMAMGLLIWFTHAPGVASAEDPPATAKQNRNESVFGLTKLHQIRLQFSAKEYAALEPKGGGFPQMGPGGPPGGPGRPGPGGPGPGRPGPGGAGPGRPGPGGPGGGGIAAAGGFGYQFEYVHAVVQADDETFQDAGVRYKGNATYMMSSRLAKRPFKLDFDRFDESASFHGVKKLNLHCSVFDAARAKEALAYAVFRAAGVPAPQTALAEVSLTVPGRYDAENLGLYTVVEQVDKAFLKTHFKSAKGLLLKPEGMRGIMYLGDDPAAYEKAYDGKNGGDEKQWERLIAFAKLVNQAGDEQFQKEIGGYLDVDSFWRFLAVNTLLVNFDSFLGLGHNYYLYLVPETNKFAFFPWDLDLAFGSHPMFGPMDQQIDISISHPHVGEINLIDRLLAIPEMKQAFREELRRINETVLSSESLAKQIVAIEAATKEPLAREKKAAENRKEGGGFGFGPPGGGNPFGGAAMDLRKFVQARSASVTSQLAGKSQGKEPRPAMGPGGPGGPGPNLGGMLARPVLNAADTNKDGKLSREEIESATSTLLKKFDKDANGLLDEGELGAAINSLVQPPQFGPPGGPNRPPQPPTRPKD